MRQYSRRHRPNSERRQVPELTKRQVSRPRQALIELGQDINYGWVEDLPVRGGEPDLEAGPVIHREITFLRENGPRRELTNDDFVLKAQVVELLEFFDERKDFVVQRLEFKAGLPFRMVVREAAA